MDTVTKMVQIASQWLGFLPLHIRYFVFIHYHQMYLFALQLLYVIRSYVTRNCS